MGTYYRVSYTGDQRPGLQATVDSLLVALNLEVSTYIDQSVISRFNQDAPIESGPHFYQNYLLAAEIYQKTNGLFDPTVMPLVNYWGFGYTPKKPVTAVDSIMVDSLRRLVGFELITFNDSESAPAWSKPPGVQLDLSALAKGYGVDLIGQFLEELGRANFFVDIGGEVLAKGDKGEKGPWRIGIAMPREDAAPTDIQVALPVRDAAIATSGNYRNFYEVNGTKYSHTINPRTGYPERSRLLSASVMAPDCATADGFATACMVAGLEEAYALIDSLPTLEAYFIYSREDGSLATRYTQGFEAMLNDE